MAQVKICATFRLDASAWIGQSETFFAKRPVVIINPATSVHSRYYSHFANYLYANGFDVVTYDYRGIGNSRPNTMRGTPVATKRVRTLLTVMPNPRALTANVCPGIEPG